VRSFDAGAVPRDVLRIAETFRANGHRAWIVGGCVRDVLMGRAAKDWDLATTALPEQVLALFRRVIPTGIQHGTVTVMLGGTGYEVTTLRGEGAYSDGRRPDSVHFVGSIEEDLARRDFTVNAIAFDPIAGAIVDPWGGLADLEARVIRAVGEARERFAEDGLRALRAARFVATLEMTLDPATEAAIPGALATFAKVSPERVRDEWEKACRAPKASPAFAVMRRTGMLTHTAPMLADLGAESFEIACRRMDAAPPELAMRVGSLVRDVVVTKVDLDAWLRAYRFSNEDRQRVLTIHEHRTKRLAADVPAPERRRLLSSLGSEAVLALATIASADAVARGVADEAAAFADQVRADLAERVPLSTRDLAITGNDLMKELAIPPSRALGRLLEALLGHVLDDPSENERGRLLALAAKLHASSSS
jgi:tRNA nucleotidyltransferase (CCA-adding enzyme)